ncbi:MAG: sulfatase-like hydrolase/transferase [Bryobacteraceae bacterium]|jgi:arylsulfatase A-like enzyme
MNCTRRAFFGSAATPLLARTLLAQKSPASPRPNLVLLVAEDLAAWMLGCYGNLEIKTPNLDRLAASGSRFGNHFLCTPASSASRATLLTGRIPRQHGIADFLTAAPRQNPERGQSAPPASFATEVLLSDVLSSSGYRCAFVGRWDLGRDERPGHGFSETATLPAADPVANDPSLFLNGQLTRETGPTPAVLTRRASAFLEKQSSSNPFFLVVSYPGAGPSYDGLAAKYLDLYKTAGFQTFGIQPASPSALDGKDLLAAPLSSIRKAAASVSALDEQIGSIQRSLIQRGLFENTLVVFTSVTGQFLGRHGLWGSGYASNPPNFFEEAIRTPLILSWPGHFPTQSLRPELAGLADFVPTACEALGVPLPSGRNLSGRSYLTIASGKPLPKRHPWTDLVFGELRAAGMVRDSRFKLISRPEDQGPNEFYDLRNDPGERINQYANQAFVDARDHLAAELRAWHEKYSG